jgi:hypothetical protein
MDDVLLSKILKSLEHLDGKPSDQAEGNSLEIIVLDEFVKINGEEFKGDHQMFPKDNIILDPNNIESIIWIVLLQMHQNLKLYTSLMLEPLFVADQFHSHKLLSFMIKAFKSLSEAALPKKLNNFETVSNMIFHYNLIVSSLIVETEVVWMQWRSLYLLGTYS